MKLHKPVIFYIALYTYAIYFVSHLKLLFSILMLVITSIYTCTGGKYIETPLCHLT